MNKKLIISAFFLLCVIANISESFARPGGGSSFRSSRSYSSRSYSSSSSSYKSKSYSSSSSYKSTGYKSTSYGKSSSYTPSYSSSSTSTNSVGTYSNGSEATWEEIFWGFAIFIALIIFFIYLNYLIIRYIYKTVKKIFFSKHNSAYNNFQATGTSEVASDITVDKINYLIENFKERDENFSRVLFLDFVNSLYTKFYMGFTDRKALNNLKPFINAEDLEIQANGQGKISQVIIGSIDIIDIFEKDGKDLITVEIDANYALDNAGYQIKYLLLEKWCFMRDKNVLSKTPEQMKNLSCPSCGGANNLTDAGLCTYCGAEIVLGKMQWALKSKKYVLYEQFLDNEGLGSDVDEEGSDLPTLKQDDLSEKILKFKEKNNNVDFDSFLTDFKEKTVKSFFLNLYNRWSNNKLELIRPFISDRLYESFSFWINNYKSKGQVNRVEGIKISNIELVKIDLDKFYDSMTVRIFAESSDYTEDNKGKVVAGSRSKTRKFTEYWTFIKKAGLEIESNTFDINNCPSCAAPVAKNAQSAKCAYCGSITNDGDFYWTLTAITQDETYRG